jgi:hypothetical protein
MIDRTASLRAIITGRGNSADFTDGARKSNKRLSHRRMRLAGKEEIRQQEEEMRDAAEEQWLGLLYDEDFGPYLDSWERDYVSPEKEKHEQCLARRRARYHERKIEKQVEPPEARQEARAGVAPPAERRRAPARDAVHLLVALQEGAVELNPLHLPLAFATPFDPSP